MAAQGVGRFGIADLIPGLGAWIQQTREGIEAPFRERFQAQAQGLLGQEQELMSAGDQGLMAGAPEGGLFGVGDVQTQAATGLMQDPSDFYQQMQFGLGLMGTPGYEAAGQAYAGQSLMHQLGLGERLQQQQNFQQNQLRQQQQAAATLQASQNQQRIVNERAENIATANQSGALYKDALKQLQPLRESLALADNVQMTVRKKGFSGLTITDQVILTKSLAKILQPTEAVMEGDIVQLQNMEGIPAFARSFAAKLGAGMRLIDEEAKQLYDALFQLAEQKGQEYQTMRGDFTERAQRRGFNVDDVMNTAFDADLENLNQGGTRPGLVTPELNAELDAKWAKENPSTSIFPEITAPQWWQDMMK